MKKFLVVLFLGCAFCAFGYWVWELYVQGARLGEAYEGLREDRKAKERAMVALGEEKEALGGRIEAIEADLEKMRGALAERAVENRQDKDQLWAQKAYIAEIEKALEDREREWKKNQREMESRLTDADSARGDLERKLREERMATGEMIKGWRSQQNKLREMAKKTVKELEKMEEKALETEGRARELEGDLAEVKQGLQVTNRQNVQLSNELLKTSWQRDVVSQENVQVHQTLSSALDEIRRLNWTVAHLREVIRRLEASKPGPGVPPKLGPPPTQELEKREKPSSPSQVVRLTTEPAD